MATMANGSAIGKELPVSILEQDKEINDSRPAGISQDSAWGEARHDPEAPFLVQSLD